MPSRLPRISLFCSIASSCKGCSRITHGVLTGCSHVLTGVPPKPGTKIIGVLSEYLQAGLEDFDEAADLVGDLGARRAELGRADDLTRKSASEWLDTRRAPRRAPWRTPPRVRVTPTTSWTTL